MENKKIEARNSRFFSLFLPRIFNQAHAGSRRHPAAPLKQPHFSYLPSFYARVPLFATVSSDENSY